MTSIYSVYDQLAEIISLLEPEKLMRLKASTSVQTRFDQLASKHREGVLTRQEKDELDHFIVMERLFRLAKIRADKA